MSKAKTKAKPVAKAKAKLKAKTKTAKPKPEPYKFTKMERITRKDLVMKFDACHEGILWWDKVFGKSKPMELNTDAVPGWFEKYIPAVTFNLQWSAWLLRQLIEKMVDQMDLNTPRYGAECKRLYAVHKVFEREASKAARDNSLNKVNMQVRVNACIVLMQSMIVTYNKL